jgi:hypothetical protein
MQSLRRDGVDLCYEEAQGDDPPVLLVHGWCCAHAYFAPQFEHFARRGNPVVAADLREHGRSDKPRQTYTMQVFADDLAWVCERLQLAKQHVVVSAFEGLRDYDPTEATGAWRCRPSISPPDTGGWSRVVCPPLNDEEAARLAVAAETIEANWHSGQGDATSPLRIMESSKHSERRSPVRLAQQLQ